MTHTNILGLMTHSLDFSVETRSKFRQKYGEIPDQTRFRFWRIIQ